MHDSCSEILVTYSDGVVSLREVFAFIFYIRKPHLEIAKRVERSICEFVDLVSISALPFYFDTEGNQESLTENSLHQLIHDRFWGPDSASNAHIELEGNGIYAPDYFLWYCGHSLNIPELADEVSYLWCWVPKSFFLNQRSRLLDYIERHALNLPCSFAYASLSLCGDNMYNKQALAKRYPGLDIALPDCVATDIGSKAAGSYWVTFLGPELCNFCGGIYSIRAKLPEEIFVEELPGAKCKILLGNDPEIGDVNRRNVLPLYKLLAKFFNDIGILHIPERVIYFKDSQGLADRDAQIAWHRRFLV